MFDKTNFKEIGKDIYVYKNFLTKEYCDEISNLALKLEENKWDLIGDSGRYLSKPGTFNFEPIYEKIVSEIKLQDGFQINHGSRTLKMIKNSYMTPHADNIEFDSVIKQSEEYVDGEPFELRENINYGIVIYFNEFEGGELEYINQGITYKPNQGDFVIHSAKEHCAHGVKNVLSDVRYSYSNSIFNYVKIKPGLPEYTGLGKSKYVSETMPTEALDKDTWFKPSSGESFILQEGVWKNIPK